MTQKVDFKTILLVDDELDNRKLYSEILGDLGYKVIATSDGSSALSVVQQGPRIDLVITDYIMPEMNGLEFIGYLRTLLPSVPVILVTAFASAESYLQSYNLGAVEYVNKPVRMQEFQRIVAKALDGPGRSLTFGEGRTS